LSSIVPKTENKSPKITNREERNEEEERKKLLEPLELTGFQKFCKYYNGIGFGIAGMYLGAYIPAYAMSYGAMSVGFFSNDLNNFFGLLSLLGPVCMVTMPTGIYFGWKYGKLYGGYAIPFSTFMYSCLLAS